MSESICKFLPPDQNIADIRTISFVYETEYKRFTQPFLDIAFKAIVVTDGKASFRNSLGEWELSRGTLFFSIPGTPYYIDGTDDFRYIYIAFSGNGAVPLLEGASITAENFVFQNKEELCEFFERSIKNSADCNCALLSKGLLYFALANVAPSDKIKSREAETLFSAVVEYVDAHYTDSSLSLGSVANTFSYTEKYLSSLFKKHMKIGFNRYLTNLRIQKARELLSLRIGSVAEIGALCGFESPLYFSKVFKKYTRLTPSEHMRTAKSLEGRRE